MENNNQTRRSATSSRLRNLRNTKASPSLRTPQGVQAFTTVFLGLLTSFGIGFLINNSAYAASYINVSSGSGGTISFDSIKPSSAGVSASASDTLTITTNCSAGYKVYVSGQENGDTNLTNSSASSNNTISASSTAVGSTATALSSNTWGITGDSASASANKYVGLPAYANATDAALITVPSASTSGNNANTIYYGVKVDTTLTPGTYSGDVLYTTLVTEACNNYTVHFNANGGSGTMSDQTIPVGKSTYLTMNAFARPGYMFLGWGTSSSSDTTPTYKDGEKVTDISGFNTTITLYALWGQSTGNMQDAQCSKLAAGATTYLTDSRDNQVYSIYRWPNTGTTGTDYPTDMAGACIMTKDLSLGYVTGGSITKGDDLVLTVDTSAAEATITARTDKSDWSTTDSDDNKQYINGPQSDKEEYSSHSYYSFGAAQKVCPAGWSLPTLTQYNNIGALVKNISGSDSTKLVSAPYNFVYGGIFGSSSGWRSAGSYGNYWSSTQYSSANSYYLSFSSSVIVLNGDFKNEGMSVRCVAEDNYTIAYSSDGASGEASKTSELVYESGSVTMPTVGTMTKSGYEFKGWALTSGATEATYTAEQTVSISTLITAASSAGQTPTPGSTITLYPVWEKSVAYMQDVSASDLTESATTTLRDSRDNQDYTVYRWPSTGTAGTDYPTGMAGYAIMTKDLSLGYVTGGSVTAGSNLSLTTAASNFDSNTAETTGSSKETVTYSSTETVTARTGKSDWSTTNSYTNKQYINGTGGTYGNHTYYSWGAAMVACPKGWRLPTNAEYNNIATFMGGNNSTGSGKIQGNPYNFVYGGYFNTPGWTNVGNNGHYWSSTQDSSTFGRYLDLNSSGLLTYYFGKYLGMPARCVAEYTPDCSETVHPTTTTGCKMKDNNIWIYGNSGNTTAWKSSYTCPTGYSSPSKETFDSLVSAQGSGNQLYSALGLSDSDSRAFWSTTLEYVGGSRAYYLYANSSSAGVNLYDRSRLHYVLCYK